MINFPRILLPIILIALFGAVALPAGVIPCLNQEPRGWKEVEALGQDGQKPPFPTIEYTPIDGRNAKLLYTVIGKGNGRISNITELKKLHALLSRQYLASPTENYETKELKLKNGLAVLATFEDPDLVGKPPVKDDFKFTTTVAILFESGVVAHASLYSDERTGKTFDEEIAMIQNCGLKVVPEVSSAQTQQIQTSDGTLRIAMPKLDVVLNIPAEGMQATSDQGDKESSYFSFARNDGLMISGWLEPVEKYTGFRSLWNTDKARMEDGMGVKIQSEMFQLINGWQTVVYAIKISEDMIQWNLRACRTSKLAWADVHISTTGGNSGPEKLKEFLKKLVFTPKEQPVSGSHSQ